MSNTLLEANFPTVDLRAIYNRKAQPKNENPTEHTPSNTESSSELDLEKLLLEKGADINTAKKIVAFGDPFKNAVKILGTKTEKGPGANPILAFVLQDYVKNKLIGTGLLNAETFKAIYNAVAQKLVNNSNFFESNEYNVIYCPDWYSKTLTEMMKYLKLQKEIDGLNPNKQSLNKKVFFNDEKAKASEATLNTLDAARKLAGVKEEADSENNEQKTKSANSVSNFLNKLTDPSEWFAVLNYLSTKVDIDEVKDALQNAKFKGLTGEAITKASQKVFPKLRNSKISEDTARLIVSLIVSKLG